MGFIKVINRLLQTDLAGSILGLMSDQINKALLAKIALTFLLLNVWVGSTVADTKATNTASENNIKVAFVSKFIAFSKWPETVNRDKLKIGVLNNSDISTLLEYWKTNSKNESEYTILSFDSLDDYQQVDVFWAGKNDLKPILEQIKQQPVMIIGEGVSCWHQNLHICLLDQEENFRFKLDLYSFQQSDLKISSKVIRLAKEVRK